MTLPCIACGRALEGVALDAEGNQPYNGTAFITHGHYGSTIYDPMDGHFLEINICDPCLAMHPERVLEGRDREPIVEDGAVVGWKDSRLTLAPWEPTEREIDYALGVMRTKRGEVVPDPFQRANEESQ